MSDTRGDCGGGTTGVYVWVDVDVCECAGEKGVVVAKDEVFVLAVEGGDAHVKSRDGSGSEGRDLEGALLLRCDVDVCEAAESPYGSEVWLHAIIGFPLCGCRLIRGGHEHVLNEIRVLEGELPAVGWHAAGNKHALSKALESAPESFCFSKGVVLIGRNCGVVDAVTEVKTLGSLRAEFFGVVCVQAFGWGADDIDDVLDGGENIRAEVEASVDREASAAVVDDIVLSVKAASVHSDEAIVMALEGFDLDMTGEVESHGAPWFVLEAFDCVFGSGLSLCFTTNAAIAEGGGVAREAFEVLETNDSIAVC